MKCIGLLALALTSVVFIAGCIQIQTNIGPTASETRGLSPFTSIDYKLHASYRQAARFISTKATIQQCE
ncbi:MAG: hypothetical protein ACXVI3_03470 [Halobacteriota archaeon]